MTFILRAKRLLQNSHKCAIESQIAFDFHIKGEKTFAKQSQITLDFHVKGNKTFATEAQFILDFHVKGGKTFASESQITLDFHNEGQKHAFTSDFALFVSSLHLTLPLRIT